MIKVLLADDHSIVRAGLKRIVDDSPDMEVIAEASNGIEALKKIREKSPDVAIIDLSMPEMDGLEVLDELKLHFPDLPVIILTMHEEDQYVVRTIEAGAKGYITKRSAPEQLVDAIRKVNDGKRYLTDMAAEALALKVSEKAQKQSMQEILSTRELQVLRRLALGHTNQEIAKTYNISVKTVDTYRLRILKKMKLRNNSELSIFAIKNKLIEP
ncbi:MAG: response regulator transcription factor [Desulfobacterales bacterium]|nr:response regulator transcription factor [Desulfobacterales bacterium]MCP4159176.1 response regulator transcription factor [Deltaproteobacteria bacterium]